jgi:hypothetical protein
MDWYFEWLPPSALNAGGDGRLAALLNGVAQAVSAHFASLGDDLLVLFFQNLYGPTFHLIDGAAIQVFDFFFELFDQVNQRYDLGFRIFDRFGQFEIEIPDLADLILHFID